MGAPGPIWTGPPPVRPSSFPVLSTLCTMQVRAAGTGGPSIMKADDDRPRCPPSSPRGMSQRRQERAGSQVPTPGSWAAPGVTDVTAQETVTCRGAWGPSGQGQEEPAWLPRAPVPLTSRPWQETPWVFPWPPSVVFPPGQGSHLPNLKPRYPQHLLPSSRLLHQLYVWDLARAWHMGHGTEQ